MAITDNLVSHVYAESGDSAITDKERSVAFSGAGSPVLSSVNGEDSWNLPAGVDQTLTVPDHTVTATGSTTPGGGFSVALRYQINTFGNAAGFNQIFGAGDSGSAVPEINFTKNGANTRVRLGGSGVVTTTDCQTTGTVHTLVMVFRVNRDASSSDYVEIYKNQASRSVNDPDFITNAVTSGNFTVDTLAITAPDSMDWDLLDVVYWNRELTDAEAASVADDLRTEIPTGGGGDSTAPTFSVAPAVSAIAQTTADLDATIDEAGDVHWVVVPQADAAPSITEIQAGQANGGGSPVAFGSALAGTVLDTQITGLTAGTAYAAYLVAQDDEGTPNVQGAATQVNFSTLAASAGTITTFPITNGTGSLLKSQLCDLVLVYEESANTLVYSESGVTSDANTAIVQISDVSLQIGTTYTIEVHVGDERGIQRATAA